MQIVHNYHHHDIHKLAHSDFWRFEFSLWLHIFARAMIAIFVPILMLKTGYSIGIVMIYFAILHIVDLPMNFFTRWLIRQIGARWVMILGNVVVVAYFILFYGLGENNLSLLILLAVLAAIYDTFYWISHLYLFVKSENENSNQEQDVTTLYIVKRIAGILGPAIGALILIFFNREILVAVSILFFLLSVIPLLRMEHAHDIPKTKQVSFKKFFSLPEERKNFLSRAMVGIHGVAENAIWPIFIFVIFGTLESVAAIPIIVSITTMIFTYFVGKITARRKEQMIILGSFLTALVWIIRISLESTVLYYVSIFLVGMFALLIFIPLDSDIFSRAKKGDTLSAVTYRNLFSMAARAIIFIILALLVNVFQVSFIFAILSLFGLMLINYAFLYYKRNQLARA